MSSFDEQMARVREVAKEAAKVCSIGCIINLNHLLGKVKVSPAAHIFPKDDIAGEVSRENACRDYLLTNIPYLISLAIYAWYKLEEESRKPAEKPVDERPEIHTTKLGGKPSGERPTNVLPPDPTLGLQKNRHEKDHT